MQLSKNEPSKLSLWYETNYIRKIDLYHLIHDYDELGSSYFSERFQSSVDFLIIHLTHDK